MIGMKLKELRQQKRFSQEYVAEQLSVSRQTVAKWENNETLPDLLKCKALARLYEVSLDSLAQLENEPPQDKFIFGPVKVGERGQIVIPQRARQLFQIQPGDQLLVLGDLNQGLALMKIETEDIPEIELFAPHSKP